MPILPLPPWSMFVLATLAMVAWLALLGLLLRTTASPAMTRGVPRSDLGPETPAIVDLITGGWRLCHREAASATLLDLAARRVLAIEEIGPELSLVRLRRDVDHTALRPYERMVLEHVSRLAVDGVVATGALAEGARHLSTWWKGFHREVLAEARRDGLIESRWSHSQMLLLTAASVAPATAAAAWVLTWSPIANATDDRWGGAFGMLVLVVGGLRVLLGKLNTERGTRRGSEAAGRWLDVADHLAATGGFAERPAAAVTIWGRPMAYAAALGLAPTAVASLPVSIVADATRAWSDHGGRWHHVEVRYRNHRLFWGRRWTNGLSVAAIAGLVGAMAGSVAGSLVGVFLLDGIAMGTVYVFILTGVAIGGGWPLYLAITDRAERTGIEGHVVRSRRIRTGGGDHNTPVRHEYWVALETVPARTVPAYATDETVWRSVREGDVVRAVVGPRLGWMYQAEVLVPSRHRAHPDADQHGRPELPRPDALGRMMGALADRVLAPSSTIDPSSLLPVEELNRVLGPAFGPAEIVPGSEAGSSQLGLETCRYRRDNGQVTVEVQALAGRRGALLMPLAMRSAGGSGRSGTVAGGTSMLWPDTALVLAEQRGACLITVRSPHVPPGPERMDALAQVAARSLHALTPG